MESTRWLGRSLRTLVMLTLALVSAARATGTIEIEIPRAKVSDSCDDGLFQGQHDVRCEMSVKLSGTEEWTVRFRSIVSIVADPLRCASVLC